MPLRSRAGTEDDESRGPSVQRCALGAGGAGSAARECRVGTASWEVCQTKRWVKRFFGATLCAVQTHDPEYSRSCSRDSGAADGYAGRSLSSARDPLLTQHYYEESMDAYNERSPREAWKGHTRHCKHLQC